MRYPRRLVTGRFVRRYKRFFVDCVLDSGESVTAHVANTGRMTGCAEPGAPCRLLSNSNPRRKLAWSLEQVQMEGLWISVHTGRPNRLVEEAVAAGQLEAFEGWSVLRREPRLEEGRADLLLARGEEQMVVEVKSATLLRRTTAGAGLVFPDSVSTRGRRHMEALGRWAESGGLAALVFVAGHEGGQWIAPADDIDPAYGQALREAAACGVRLLGYRARMSEEELVLTGPVPVSTNPAPPATP